MLQSEWLQEFQCLGDQCGDTCCRGWGMQVDALTLQRYRNQAPELLECVTEGEAAHVMKRDAQTDYCVKFEQGWCGVHAKKGTDFLGDACHFFPRVTRQLGETVLQTATLSCPETARLALSSPAASGRWQEVKTPERLPFELHNYLPAGMETEQALQLHQAFLEAAGDESADAARIVARLHTVAESLMRLERESWPMAAAFYLKSADSRLSQPQPRPENPFRLYAMLAGLVGAAPIAPRKRLETLLLRLAMVLEAQWNPQQGTVALSENSVKHAQQMRESWQFVESQWQPFFRRWLQAQLGIALFPFSGFGETLADRVMFIGLRLAILRLSMQSLHFAAGTLSQEDAVNLAQTLARFLDHLADPTLSKRICEETGWNKTPALWGLLV